MAAFCGACRARIVWVKTPNNRSMPLDAEPTPDGTVAIIDGLAVIVANVRDELAMVAGPRRFMPHWASCPEAASFRKAKKP